VSWTWRLEGVGGASVATAVSQSVPVHQTQSDAETWLGETWRSLAEEGVAQASLFCDSELIYGPMALVD